MAEAPLAPRDVAAAGLCIGCGGCAGGAGAMGWDRFGQLKPEGAWAAEAMPALSRICPFSPDARDEDAIAADRFPQPAHRDPLIGSFETAYVGHVAEGGFRAGGSSGGMVSWVAAELLRLGLVDGVAHVAPADPVGDGRFFGYRMSRTEGEIGQGARSRYYPVEMSAMLAEIRAVPGRYAVVGVPCFIKAVQLLRAEEPVLHERIAFTLGLFCGHMKSARLVDSFAWQLGAPVDQVRAVEYRRKDPDRPANWYTAHLTLADGTARWQDWWHLVDGDWGAGFFQNPACNYCDDVVAEAADIAFGDAWVEPYSSDGRGTNVVIVRRPEVQRIVADAVAEGRLALDEVDAAFISGTQAAGFRQRREGLGWRLRVAPPRLPLRKRVAPGGRDLPFRRKLVYASRLCISAGSHRIFALARATGWHGLYLGWARLSLRTYEAFAYLRWPLGRLLRRLEGGAAGE
ncbi:Coenzyme F420 hydrogenase/dehydrogenase, beta subunit C-terminal domain [Sphingomonas profundi]|uniref:Coenzyme F420 hydrogenase/dehydrogenase, beta subunit C-terminal domain n=1 Tax=Alterirhizorhabdus profundi TaxID=2681549 RepID=UPI0018D08F1D|nr:Coenzyme F420 hydrogenase/dehydrogenase, beta subunit C-terminal domain [Sphingomonas profundi]